MEVGLSRCSVEAGHILLLGTPDMEMGLSGCLFEAGHILLLGTPDMEVGLARCSLEAGHIRILGTPDVEVGLSQFSFEAGHKIPLRNGFCSNIVSSFPSKVCCRHISLASSPGSACREKLSWYFWSIHCSVSPKEEDRSNLGLMSQLVV